MRKPKNDAANPADRVPPLTEVLTLADSPELYMLQKNSC